MRPTTLQTFGLIIGLSAVACSGELDEPGAVGSASSAGKGGGAGAGGSVSTGGTGVSGGTSGTGGQTTAGSGGTPGAGGTASGGASGSTGCTNVRPTGTEWDEATCDQWATETSECGNAWMINGNYCNQSCGRCTSGSGGSSGSGSGGTASGGTSGSGGAVVIPDTCTEGDGMVCNNQSGRHCGYTYEYWKDQGSGCLTNTSDGFSVEWSNINNLLGRKGLRPGSRNQIVTYDANYQPNGSSYLCVYGWTRNPLVEYYIVDAWGSWRPPGGESMGSVSSDGGTYELYRTERVNQPSIEGTRTFYQYWSVRTEPRTSGVITVGNHFSAWEGVGLTVGSLYEVSMTVEGYQSSGTADVAMTMQ